MGYRRQISCLILLSAEVFFCARFRAGSADSLEEK